MHALGARLAGGGHGGGICGEVVCVWESGDVCGKGACMAKVSCMVKGDVHGEGGHVW